MEESRARRTSFETLYRTHADAVLAYLLRRAGREDAADAAATTFLVAWRRFDEVPAGRERPWLYGVARRVLADQRRASRRQEAVVARVTSEQHPVADFGTEVGRQRVLEALATLDEGEREALMLSVWEGLSGREAALVLACSPLAYRLRLHRARLRLRSALGDQERERKRPRRLRQEVN